jgi:hypothetical protein
MGIVNDGSPSASGASRPRHGPEEATTCPNLRGQGGRHDQVVGSIPSPAPSPRWSRLVLPPLERPGGFAAGTAIMDRWTGFSEPAAILFGGL